MEYTTTATAGRKRVSARYVQNIAPREECTPTGGNNTPKEATATQTERQRARIPDITPKEAIVTETECFCAVVQVMLHYNANNSLEEEQSPTTAGASSTGAGSSTSEEEASSSPEIGESTSRAGALRQDVGVPLSVVTPAISLGDAHSTTTGAEPDVPHHDTACTRPNPSVEDTVDNTHSTGTSETNFPTDCVEFTYAERDPFRITEEENRVIKIPNDHLRNHPLDGSASTGITGIGITGARIIGASSYGIFGITSS